jgi:hypothetical protein
MYKGETMKLQRLLQVCGILSLLLVGFHLSFWRLFRWQADLALLTPDNRAIMQVLNLHTAYALAMFGILSLCFSEDLRITKLGRIVSLAIAGFWLLRGVNQPIFWGVAPASSWVILFVCFAVAAVYVAAAMHKNGSPDLTLRG